MEISGFKISEKTTDIAIKNMKAYLELLSEKEKSASRFKSWKKRWWRIWSPRMWRALIGRSETKIIKEDVKLEDINKFANMTKLIDELSNEKKWIDMNITDLEKEILSKLKTMKTIGTVRRNIIIDHTLSGTSSREDIMKLVFEMLYPSKNTEDLIERFKYIEDTKIFLLDVFDSMPISEIADDNNFVKKGESGKAKIEATEKFKETYNKLLQSITYGELKDLMDTALEDKLKDKLKELINSKKNNNDNLNSEELEKEKTKTIKETIETIGKQLEEKDLGKYSVEELEDLKQKLESIGIDYDSVKEELESEIEKYLKSAGIDYDKIKNNYNNIVNKMVDKGDFVVGKSEEQEIEEAEKMIRESKDIIAKAEEIKKAEETKEVKDEGRIQTYI